MSGPFARASSRDFCLPTYPQLPCRLPANKGSHLCLAGRAFPRRCLGFGIFFSEGKRWFTEAGLSLKRVGVDGLQAGCGVVIYARQAAGLMPVHVPALFVVLKLLGFWFQPSPLRSVGRQKCSYGCCGMWLGSSWPPRAQSQVLICREYSNT